MSIKRKKNTKTKTVETLTHPDDKRPNIPTAELQPVMEDDDPVPVTYKRNRDLDPQFVWRGKDEQDWSDLVVQAPPLFIQEKVHPKVLIDDLMRHSQSNGAAPEEQLDLFADFNGLPREDAKTEFYQHDANWSNRMILGDSLRVMASLAEREGLCGKVQCIYIDPPYGIKFNSNFQWSTTSRDVQDGKAEHITREPEQVKAFRDTWRDGIHSYLTYLRDRLTVARDLLTESGSVFVQISDENVHRVRALMDEIYGSENFVSQIGFVKTTSAYTKTLSTIYDFILWYAKSIEQIKYRQVYEERPEKQNQQFEYFLNFDGQLSKVTGKESSNGVRVTLSDLFRRYGATSSGSYGLEFKKEIFYPRPSSTWATSREGLERLKLSNRLSIKGQHIFYARRIDDFPYREISNFWHDTSLGGFTREHEKVFVVQTARLVVQRCILMATDPGDLVLDPTCGSGTAANARRAVGQALDYD